MMVGAKLSGILVRLSLACTLALASAAAGAATILVFGDSLSAAHGLQPGEGWVSLLEKRLHAEKLNYKVVNASISGETTLGGRNRIGAALKDHQPAIVILELGANDGLRGGAIETMHANLEAIIDASRQAKARVLLVGIRLPPNYGTAYSGKFQQVYPAVAKSKKVPLVPFVFEGFADKPDYFLPDGIHPAAHAQPLMLDLVWKELRPLLGKPATKTR